MARMVFTFSDLDQSTGSRHMRPGSLTVSQNTRATKTGPRRKRRGFARRAIIDYVFPVDADDTDSSPAATMQELSPGGEMFRDTNDNIWARTSDGDTALFRGEHRRCGVTSRATGFPEHKTVKPCSLQVVTRTWHFALATTGAGSSPSSEPTYDSIYFMVEDASGTVLRGPVRIADSTASITNYCVVHHAALSRIYIFTVYRTSVVRVLSISTSTSTLGDIVDAQADFYTNADAKWNTVDAVYNTTLNQVVVAYSSWKEDEAPGNTAKIRHAILNTGTLGETSGTYAEDFNPGVTGVYLCGGVSFLQGQPFSDDIIRYVCWVKGDANQDDVLLRQYTIDASDMTVIDDDGLITKQAVRYELEHAGVCCGFYDAATDTSVVYGELIYPAIASEETDNPAGVGNSFNALTQRVVFNNTTSATTVQDACPGSWLASKPFQGADSKWYVLTGIDSGTDGYQRAFHVRRADLVSSASMPSSARVVAQINWPDASFRAHRWRANTGALPPTITNSWGWAPGFAAISSGVRMVLGRSGETPQTHATYVVTLDFAAAFSRGALVYDDMVVYPGGFPVIAGPRSPAHDLTPMVFPVQPPRLTAAGSSSALGAVFVTTSFRFRDPSGRITRSLAYPDPKSMTFNGSGTRTLAARSLQHIGHGEAEIELWATALDPDSGVAVGTLTLQTVVPNNPAASEVSIDVDPVNFRSDTEQLPVSAVGALGFNPPPPCRLVSMFAERVILSGTPVEGEFLYSQPFEAGLGPEFNLEALSQTWVGRGDINGICPVDLNSLGLFRRDQVAVVQGPGPTGAGGAYSQVLELKGGKGLEAGSTRGSVVFETPIGACFQDAQSGRLCALTPGLRVEEMPPGVEDTAMAGASGKLVAGGLQEAEGAVWFMFGGGAIAALDMRHPDDTNASKWGNWHVWTSSALTETSSVGLVERDGGPLWLQANAGWRTYKSTGQLFQDTNAVGAQVDVLQAYETGLLADAHHEELCVLDMNILGTHNGVSSLRITTTNDAVSTETHDATTATPFNYAWRPGNLLRTQEFRVRIEELAGSTSEGFDVDSIGIEYERQNRMKRLGAGKVI